MAGVMQLVANLVNVNGLPEDTAQNVVHLEVAGSDPAGQDITDACNAFRDFYNTFVAPATTALATYIGEGVSRAANACSIVAYFTNDLTGGTPFGSPIGTVNFTLNPTNPTNQLPEEVAVVLSLHGDLTDIPATAPNPNPPPATIRPQQRRRGRLFLGPLNSTAGAEINNNYRPAAALLTNMTIAFEAFYNAIVLTTPYVPAVWSKADAATYPITGGYVDDAWDTQRRRGLAATTRTSFAI